MLDHTRTQSDSGSFHERWSVSKLSPFGMHSHLLGFEARIDFEQHELGEKYRQLTTPTARKNFVRDFAMCYTQLSRLPYFDLVNQIVIDPMHNLFLGMLH